MSAVPIFGVSDTESAAAGRQAEWIEERWSPSVCPLAVRLVRTIGQGRGKVNEKLVPTLQKKRPGWKIFLCFGSGPKGALRVKKKKRQWKSRHSTNLIFFFFSFGAVC